MKIVYNIFVKVRKLWDAIFGRNGDGSEVNLAGTIDGASAKVELGVGLSLDGNTLSAETGGTEVEPLSSVSGSEPTFRGLKIDGSDYQVYRQPVDGNVGHTSSAPDLQDILIGDTVYKIPSGTEVVANPTGTGSTRLTKLSVENTIYKVPDGATNGLGYLTTAPTSANTDGIKIVVLSAEPATKYAGYLYIITA